MSFTVDNAFEPGTLGAAAFYAAESEAADKQAITEWVSDQSLCVKMAVVVDKLCKNFLDLFFTPKELPAKYS
jgi:hypothetical protein